MNHFCQGFIYLPINPQNACPSYRYLQVLCRGAEEAGLKQSYIEKLTNTQVYNAMEMPEVKESRETRSSDGLREITAAELSRHVDSDPWLSILGYVIRLDPYHGIPRYTV